MASNFSGPYLFQTAGAKTTFEMKVTSEGLFARVDMPGVEEGEVGIVANRNTVFFRGEAIAEQVRMMYPRPRSYRGGFKLPFVGDFPRQIKSLVKDGVVRFFIAADLSYAPVAEPCHFVILPLPLPSAEEGNRDRNPFQVGGLKSTLEQFITSEDKIYVRADLPGVEVVNWKNLLIPDQTCLYFKCVAPQEWEFEDKPERMYGGRIRLNCDCCFVKNINSIYFNGVLTLRLSKRKKNNSDPNAKCDLATH